MQAKSGSIAEIVTKTKETAEKAAQQQAEIKKNAKASKVNIKELAPSAGKWSVDPKIDMDTLTTKQTAAVSYLKAVSEVSGMNITLMSGVDVTGAFSVENGHYDGVTNTLYVSVNAGMQSITDITGSAILKTASHEITHYIAASGTQTYSLLEDYVLSRFTEQYGEKSVDNRIEDIQEQYKDQVGKELTREQAKEEMVAAACEMMLKNSEVFEKLARQNLTLAQRIKAGLDGFIKKLSANRKAAFENLDATSPEARAIAASETSLKETQKLWDNALKGAIKENEGRRAGKDTMLELRDEGRYNAEYEKPITSEDIEPLRSIGRKNIKDFTSEDIAKTQKWAYKFYRELGTKSPFFRASFGEWRAYDTHTVDVVSVPTIDISQATLEHGNYSIDDTGWNVYAGKTLNDDTRHHSGGNRVNVKSLNAIDYILKNAILLDTVVSEPNTNKKSANTAFLHKLYTLISYDGQLYIAKSTVEEFFNISSNDVARKAYNLKAIKIEPAGGQIGNTSSSSVPVTGSTISISNLYNLVKTNDKDFSAGAAANPILLNKDGTPKVFYHGTPFFGFNEFHDSANGIYLTDSLDVASTYSGSEGVRSVSNAEYHDIDSMNAKELAEFLNKYGDYKEDTHYRYEATGNNKISLFRSTTEIDTYNLSDARSVAYERTRPSRGNYAVYVSADNILQVPTRFSRGIKLPAELRAVVAGMEMQIASEGYSTSEIARFAKKAGYDGVIFKGIEDIGVNYKNVAPADTLVVFDPTQIKSATDNIGTFDRNNPDIRYELRDNQGRELTQAQAEKFKDSQVRDKDGRLKTVYHGSSAVFNVFSADFMSQHGSSEGQGFYFTDYKDMAEGYQKKGGQLLEGYLNITNPLSDSEVTLSAPEVKRLLKALDPTGDDVILNYDSQGGMGYPSKAWYNRALADTVNMIMSTSESDSEILAEIANAGAGSGNVMDAVRKVLGYDGYIVEGKYDNANVYVAFGSDQFKSFDNKTPTSSPDIHLELRSDENQFNPRKELSNLFMQIAQNEQEKKSLRSYQAAIHELNNTEIEISKLQQEMQGTDKLKSPQKYYELQNKLRQAEAKLNRYDGRLVQLEATKPMKDLIARREQRLKEQFARSSTTRAKYRNNIKKNIRSLDKKLRANSGQKHVLLELQPVVAQLLNVFTENTSVFKKEQLARLREIYAKFNPEADSKISSTEKEVTRWKSTAEYSSAYSEMIYDLIEEVRPLVQGKRLIDLDTDLLAAVNDIVGNIKQKSAVSKSLPRRRFSVVDQSEHFTAKPPLKKYVFVRTSFVGGL